VISGAKGRRDQLSHFNRRSKIIQNVFDNELRDSTILESSVKFKATHLHFSQVYPLLFIHRNQNFLQAILSFSFDIIYLLHSFNFFARTRTVVTFQWKLLSCCLILSPAQEETEILLSLSDIRCTVPKKSSRQTNL